MLPFRPKYLVSFLVAFSVVPGALPAAEKLGYNRDIRPILSDRCYKCHGPDPKTREGELSLNNPEDVHRARKVGAVVVPGKPEESALVDRIFTTDPDDQMPPPDSGLKLTAAEKATLRQWVAEGGEFEPHWAFIAPVRAALPPVSEKAWPRSPVDHFILAGLDKAGLKPSPETDRRTLIRRVTYDLTGLPPTREEIAAFLADTAPEAYEKVVDRLLASPRFGERMAVDWLDVARYADTNGYQYDLPRTMWRWRDWVIEAFNRNLSYDQFATEQLAGDLLPDATLEQKIATGFNRNHPFTIEGGVIDEEYRVQYVSDRVMTMGFAFLGLTFDCSKCHDHKFDPITQKDYYSMFAFFNNVPENGFNGGKPLVAPPAIAAPTAEQSARIVAIGVELAGAETGLKAAEAGAETAQREWENSLRGAGKPPVMVWETLKPMTATAKNGTTLQVRPDRSVLASGANPATEMVELTFETPLSAITGLRLEALTDASLPGTGPGRYANGNAVMTGFEAVAESVRDPKQSANVKFVDAVADHSQSGYDIRLAIDANAGSGWAVDGNTKHENRVAVFVADAPFGFAGGTRITVRLRYESPHAQHVFGAVRLSGTASADPASALTEKFDARAVAAKPEKERTAEESQWLRDTFRIRFWKEGAGLQRKVAALQSEKTAIEGAIVQTMVMVEMPQPRPAFVLERGQYDKPTDPVTARTPGSLPPMPEGAPANRLGLARWMTSAENPLFSRIAVNRFWKMLFGNGIVATLNDFGSQGAAPTHPDLIDWLAVDFREKGWDTKGLIRDLVLSATYRQSSAVTPELLAADSENHWLARMSRRRLPAEMIRDSALSVSGLLVEKLGGPSVYPYQPTGLWEVLTLREGFQMSYVPSTGDDLYRRSLYTFWKRASPPPSLQTFDAPDREYCVVDRQATTTPLQALILLNDPTYVEAARHIAGRMIREGGKTPDERLAFAFELATARAPSEAERAILKRVFLQQAARFKADPAAAAELLSAGASPPEADLNPAELASYTMAVSTILNLDEAITRE